MRYSWSAALLFCLVTPAFAGPASLLTPKEITDGWILLFDGTTTFGWKPMAGSKWQVNDGALEAMSGDKQADVLVNTSEYGNYQLRFEYKGRKGSQAQVQALASAMAKALPVGENAPPPSGKTVDVYPLPILGEDWHKATVTVKDGMITEASAESATGGTGLKSSSSAPMPRRGHIAFAGSGLQLKNVKLKPLDMKSIYNGKDLTGWKIFPGKKSTFTVNDKGELNVTNGPGDLQTEGKYGDFLLQLECISNGTHLNSGVFFRCRDGEYQNGYECQIRNEFKPEAVQEYTLEEYDPLTHKLLGKKKAKYRAVDYGTGAIYRRQPARLQASKDGEWFTLTVLAHGNHFATWVNGIQVTDWTDNRPASDNARTGCRLEAGHLSLQGHDPTTNLSFRNFRIAALPGAKK